ncbi:unnamed protein product [Allacma fusca]|uniref:Uncharacterized protein n=1 Tax=Allacma fusca TaxID=39272 RepID=A0A8J2MGG9_9HEXA|nr:unnamed protein product [Allacma fusca]
MKSTPAIILIIGLAFLASASCDDALLAELNSVQAATAKLQADLEALLKANTPITDQATLKSYRDAVIKLGNTEFDLSFVMDSTQVLDLQASLSPLESENSAATEGGLFTEKTPIIGSTPKIKFRRDVELWTVYFFSYYIATLKAYYSFLNY